MANFVGPIFGFWPSLRAVGFKLISQRFWFELVKVSLIRHTVEPMREKPNLDLADGQAVAQRLRHAADCLKNHDLRKGCCVHLPSHGQLVMTGDLHDNLINYQRILKLAQLKRSEDRYVILHEVIHGPSLVNGMELSIRMLARIADLVVQFPSQVIVMPGNHEIAQLTGENILKDSTSVVQAFTEGLEYLYGDDADDVTHATGELIRAMPLAVRTQSRMLCSHSLPAPRRIEAFDKAILTRDLTDDDYQPKGSAYDMVWGRYHNDKTSDELAKAFDVDLMITGHQPAEMGYDVETDRVMIINSDHQHGMALPINLSRTYSMDDLVAALIPLAGVTV